MMRFNIDNVGAWSIGVDNTDSDKFKISVSAVLGTNDRLVIDTGNVGSAQQILVNQFHIVGNLKVQGDITRNTNHLIKRNKSNHTILKWFN